MEAKYDIDVLVIEDNSYDAEITLRALQKNRTARKIIHVRDGEQALEFLFAQGRYSDRDGSVLPRLILVNPRTAKVNDCELFKHIKENEVTRIIPVVILASPGDDRDIVQCYLQGANSYLHKPVDLDEYVQLVVQVSYYWLGVNLIPGHQHYRTVLTRRNLYED